MLQKSADELTFKSQTESKGTHTPAGHKASSKEQVTPFRENFHAGTRTEKTQLKLPHISAHTSCWEANCNKQAVIWGKAWHFES